MSPALLGHLAMQRRVYEPNFVLFGLCYKRAQALESHSRLITLLQAGAGSLKLMLRVPSHLPTNWRHRSSSWCKFSVL